MRLSKRGEYGIRAMLTLATPGPDGQPGMIQIKEIAEREKIPAKYLEQILLALKNAGMLNSKMGIGGGYFLARPANEITMAQIVRLLDGPLAPIRCVSQMAYAPCDCPDPETCGLRMVMGDVRNAIADILDHTTLADLAGRVESQKKLLLSD